MIKIRDCNNACVCIATPFHIATIKVLTLNQASFDNSQIIVLTIDGCPDCVSLLFCAPTDSTFPMLLTPNPLPSALRSFSLPSLFALWRKLNDLVYNHTLLVFELEELFNLLS